MGSERAPFGASLLVFLAILLTAGCGPEGPYPAREIRLVVHASPGGISDAISRHVSRGLQERLGVPVVAENRNQAQVDVWVMLASGALGFVLRQARFPMGPLVLALILGPWPKRISGGRSFSRRGTSACS